MVDLNEKIRLFKQGGREYMADEIIHELQYENNHLKTFVKQLCMDICEEKFDTASAKALRFIYQKTTTKAKMPKIDEIVNAVCKFYGIQRKAVMGLDRRAKIALPRQIAMYLASKHITTSFAAIGRDFKRDHTTVIYACNSIEEKIKADDELLSKIEEIERMLSWVKR